MSMIVTPEDYEAPNLGPMSRTDQLRLQAVMRDGWRLTPATLAVKITQGRWIAARHLLYISTIVATEVAKGGARLILTMPARHGKSEFLSVNTPIWFLEKWPDRMVMNISYGSELATDFSLKVRDTFQNEELHHLLRTRIRTDKKRVDRWLTPNGGGLTAAGIGGPLTGRGADLMLIDDYIKNHEDSLSVAQRKKTWEWFKSTAYTRLEPNASLVILATRWNLKDLIGSCLTELPHENWKVINLPAFAEINDPLGREVGEALWPERYPLESLLRIKKTLGTYWWEAMYQQHPRASMAGLDLSDYLKYIPESELPERINLKTVRAWDLAATEGAGDWTAGAKISREKDSGRIFIEDMRRVQKSSGKVETLVEAKAIGDGHGVSIWMEQEPGSSGVTVIDNYKKLLKAFAFEGEKATGKIQVRATPFLAAVEAGDVVLVKGNWNEDFTTELDGFDDDAEHDDQITAVALGYNKLIFGQHGALTWGREPLPDNVTPIHAREKKDQPRRRLTWGR